jgi:hypothetical protein
LPEGAEVPQKINTEKNSASMIKLLVLKFIHLLVAVDRIVGQPWRGMGMDLFSRALPAGSIS